MASYRDSFIFYLFTGREDENNHSPLSSTEVKKSWSYISTPSTLPRLYFFMVWGLIKHSDNFAL
jgi:hypothetical protein